MNTIIIEEIIETVEKIERVRAERPPEDHDTFKAYREQLSLLKIGLNDKRRDWSRIMKRYMPLVVQAFKKLNNSEYICPALAQYLLIMKLYGKILKKKAFFILVSFLKADTKYQYDTDLVASCYLPENAFDYIKDNTVDMYLSMTPRLDDSTSIGDNLRMIHLVNEFFEKIFVREDFNKYDFEDKIFLTISTRSKAFWFIFTKKFFRHLIQKLLGEMYAEKMTDILEKLASFYKLDVNRGWKFSLCNIYYSKFVLAELIYAFWSNTNSHYMSMIKKFFVERNFNETVNENEVKEIDCSKILFNTSETDKESMNPPCYIEITCRILEFVDAYYEITLGRSLEGQEDNKNLKVYRMNSIIFNEMIQYRKNKNEDLLVLYNESLDPPILEEKANSIKVKASKALDHYVAYVRFIFFLEMNKEDYFLKNNKSIENEAIRFVNFNTFLDFSTSIAELNLVSAYIACNAIKNFIQVSKFSHYNPRVLQNFMIFLIFLKKTYKISKVLLSFFEFIKSEIGDKFKKDEYFWVSLFRVKFICEKEDLEIQDSASLKELIAYGNIRYNSGESILELVTLMMKNIKNCSKHGKFIFISLILQITAENSSFIILNNSNEFKTNFMKIASRFVHHKVYHTNSILDKFSRTILREFLPTLFELMNKFNLTVNEYYKIPKYKYFMSQEKFLLQIEKKLRVLLSQNTDIKLTHLVLYNIFELNSSITQINKEKINSKNNSENILQLEELLKEDKFLPNTNHHFNFLNLKKIYLSFKMEHLIMSSKPSNIEIQPDSLFLANAMLMIKLNSNINYEQNDKKIIIDNIILIDNSITENLASYLVKENIFNAKDKDNSKVLIEAYLNQNIMSQERKEVLKVVSILRLLRTSFNEIQKNIEMNFKLPENKKYHLGNYLRNEDCSADVLKFKTDLNREFNKTNEFNNSVISFNR